MSWFGEMCMFAFVIIYGFNTMLKLAKYAPVEETPISEEAKRIYS